MTSSQRTIDCEGTNERTGDETTTQDRRRRLFLGLTERKAGLGSFASERPNNDDVYAGVTVQPCLDRLYRIWSDHGRDAEGGRAEARGQDQTDAINFQICTARDRGEGCMRSDVQTSRWMCCKAVGRGA